MPGRLAGVSVVVARPAEQAAPFVALLEAEAARAVVVPLIEIVELDAGGLLRAAIGGLTPEDWVVVASPNGAERVAEVLAEHPEPKVAAVGARTALRLGRCDLVATDQSAAGLVAEFPSPGRGARAVLVQSADGARTLASGLAAAGFAVERIDTHRAVPVLPSAGQQLHALRADALVLTSGSQARSWAAAFGDSSPPVVVAIGPQTAADAASAGLKVSVVAADHSLAGCVEALVGCFRR